MQHTGSERCMHHAATAQAASNFCLAVWLAPMLPATHGRARRAMQLERARAQIMFVRLNSCARALEPRLLHPKKRQTFRASGLDRTRRPDPSGRPGRTMADPKSGVDTKMPPSNLPLFSVAGFFPPPLSHSLTHVSPCPHFCSSVLSEVVVRFPASTITFSE